MVLPPRITRWETDLFFQEVYSGTWSRKGICKCPCASRTHEFLWAVCLGYVLRELQIRDMQWLSFKQGFNITPCSHSPKVRSSPQCVGSLVCVCVCMHVSPPAPPSSALFSTAPCECETTEQVISLPRVSQNPLRMCLVLHCPSSASLLPANEGQQGPVAGYCMAVLE